MKSQSKITVPAVVVTALIGFLGGIGLCFLLNLLLRVGAWTWRFTAHAADKILPWP